MAQTLRDLQQATGATFNEAEVPHTFGQDDAALAAAETGAVLLDRSHWGLLQISGEDRLRFLHNQTTNTFEQRQPGEGCDTVFVTSTARTMDLANVYVTADSLLILTSPGQDQRLFDWMDRYIFPADRVSLTNLTPTTAIFSLIGPESTELLRRAGLPESAVNSQAPYGQHHVVQIADMAVRVAVGSGLGLPGWTIIVPLEAASQVWQTLVQAGAIPAGETLWQRLRIQQGRPLPGAELTEDYNPLEAGLWQSISFDKGCYIGQETIARLNTYQGVKQQLWGIRLGAMVAAGTPIKLGEEKIGTLTSVVDTADGPLGLGYIRTKAGGAGLGVAVGEATGTVIDIPFVSRGYLAPDMGGPDMGAPDMGDSTAGG